MVAPFIDIFQRNGAAQLGAIIVFIVLYKFGDALAGSMSNPLYVALGFTKVEVATIAKVYGVIATLAGVALGGVAGAAASACSGRCWSAAGCRRCRT